MNNLFIFLAVLVILFSSGSLYLGFSNYRKSDQLYKETREKFISYQEADSVSKEETAEEKSSTIVQKSVLKGENNYSDLSSPAYNAFKSREGLKSDSEDDVDGAGQILQSVANEVSCQTDSIQVDFGGLQVLNPDIIGWLYVDYTDISYPLLYSGDDEAYLRHGYDGSFLNAGSIFLRGRNAPDLSDGLSVIYGHNAQNGSMFGGLSAFGDEGYRTTHNSFRIILPDVCYRYEIDWCGVISSTDSLYATTNDGSNNRRVILSTCYGEEQRFIVSGILTEISGN